MTGLDLARSVLLEIATIVTDRDLNIVAHGPELAIHQSPQRLRAMDAWNRRTHKASGLLERVRA
jgi:oligoribonuclease